MVKQDKFIVIGIDDNREPDLGSEVLAVISGATVFSGGKRHHTLVEKFLPEGAQWIDITVPLDDVFEKYAHVGKASYTAGAYDGVHDGTIVVFASGDPLFFGFAVTLQKRLPEASIKVYPTFNSLQTLSHRLVMSYDDMRIVSLTGRPWSEFDRALIERASKIGILTDVSHTPAAIAERALEYGYTNYEMFVGECLGGDTERIKRYLLPEAARHTFNSPNCLIMRRMREVVAEHIPDRWFGIPQELFMPLNGRVKMITKTPVRLLSLSMLHLYNCKSFWDIGFCTGSVSIEAKMQFPHLRITSFEIREEGRELMLVNSKRFGTPGIDVFIGDFTVLDINSIIGSSGENGPILPPDAVFIGGHGGKLMEIVLKIYPHLANGGRIVLNAVSEQSRNLFIQAIQHVGMELGPTTSITIDQHNTIDVLTAKKTAKHTDIAPLGVV